jgi:2-keto-4-pentenoate hydratase/2-oxohepta-3-ene-1,7-dioic acid hydratase in catechol pathway
MYLVSFAVPTPLGPFERLGARQGDRFIDLHTAYAWYLAEQGHTQPYRVAEALIPPDMLGFLDGGPLAMAAARETLAALAGLPALPAGLKGETMAFDPGTVTLLAPVPRPRSLRDFLAFEAHTRKGYERRNQPFPDDWYKLPVFYKGNPSTIVAPDTTVRWPRFTQKFDYELELAAVIGKPGKDIAEADAGAHIAGYCILNDFSARDIQQREMALRLGPSKGKDWATGLGPYLVTPDELPNVRDLRMVARVNGETWSDGNSGTSHWTFEQLIAHAANEEMLQPGEIIGSGTVGGGCSYEHDRWLKPGDTIELEITGLGVLRHRVGQPDS